MSVHTKLVIVLPLHLPQFVLGNRFSWLKELAMCKLDKQYFLPSPFCLNIDRHRNARAPDRDGVEGYYKYFSFISLFIAFPVPRQFFLPISYSGFIMLTYEPSLNTIHAYQKNQFKTEQKLNVDLIPPLGHKGELFKN